MNDTDFRAACEGQLVAALWSSVTEDDVPLDSRSTTFDFTAQSRAMLDGDMAHFIRRAGILLDGLDPAQIGHDLWLTRNGHGAGFWDRGLGERGEILSKLADEFGVVDLFLEDGRVEII